MPISLKDSFRPRKSALIAVVFALLLICAACEDTYRPVAIPITKPGGDPQTTHYAMVVNTNSGQPQNPGNPTGNPPVAPGPAPSVTQIDVAGDANIANHPAGLNPIHAAMAPGFGLTYVVNQGDSTLTAFSTATGIGATAFTIPLLQNNNEPNPNASYVAASNTMAFVVESALNRVVVIDGTQLQVVAFVPVGVNPVAAVCTSDGRKAYVANQGSDTVSVISSKDDTNQQNIPVGSQPGAMAISNDNDYVFVANQGDGTVSVIDTNSDTVTNTLPVGSSPTELVWDRGLQRLYSVNRGSASVTIIDGSSFPQKVLRTVATSPTPVAVAPLDDGTKFYVLFQGNPGTVEVFDAKGYFKRTTITVGNNTLPNGLPALDQVLLSASPGSTKVYAVNYYGDAANTGGSVSIIRTLDDTVIVNMPSAAPNPTFVTTQ